MKRISAVSGKGGAGKTTLVILIAGEYAVNGNTVLLIDADGRQNLSEWWKRCEAKNNLPENIELVTAATQRRLQEVIDHKASDYDVVIMDAPGTDGVIRDAIIRNSDLVLTPVQPNQDEIKAAGEAATAAAEIADEAGVSIPHANVVTRITLPNRSLEAYRLIRPFVESLREAGYDSSLLATELVERNCYRAIRNGYGTLQMLELTEPVMKGRAEVSRLVAGIDALMEQNMEAAADER